jgi:hypothetical protein
MNSKQHEQDSSLSSLERAIGKLTKDNWSSWRRALMKFTKGPFRKAHLWMKTGQKPEIKEPIFDQNFIDQNRVLILSSSTQTTNSAREASSTALPTPLGDEDEISDVTAPVAPQQHFPVQGSTIPPPPQAILSHMEFTVINTKWKSLYDKYLQDKNTFQNDSRNLSTLLLLLLDKDMSTAVQVNTEYLELSNQTDDETDVRKLYEIIRSEANNKDSIITECCVLNPQMSSRLSDSSL